MRVVAGGAKRARLRPNPQFYGLLPSRAVSHEKPCAMAHESHVGNDSQERRVDTPHVVRCVVAGTCGYTCRPLTSRASLTRHLFIWSSRDLPRSPEIQLQIPSRPRSLPSHVASAPPAVTRVTVEICRPTRTVDRSCHTADPGPETGDSPEISACARAETPGRAIRGITA